MRPIPLLSSPSTLTPGILACPDTEEAWVKRWQALSKERLSFLDTAHPDEPPGTTTLQRADLWRRSLKGNPRIMETLSRASRETWVENNWIALIMLAPPPSCLAFLFADCVSDAMLRLTAMCLVSGVIALAMLIWGRAVVRSQRKRYLQAILSRMNEGTGLGRIQDAVEAHEAAGIKVSSEIKAFADMLSNMKNPYSIGQVSIADCLALTVLSDRIGLGIAKMRPRANLDVSGESSELLHRVADGLGYDLTALAEDIENPPTVLV